MEKFIKDDAHMVKMKRVIVQACSLKFIYCEKATKIWQNLQTFSVQITSNNVWRYRQILVALSEYMNFNILFHKIMYQLIKKKPSLWKQARQQVSIWVEQ